MGPASPPPSCEGASAAGRQVAALTWLEVAVAEPHLVDEHDALQQLPEVEDGRGLVQAPAALVQQVEQVRATDELPLRAGRYERGGELQRVGASGASGPSAQLCATQPPAPQHGELLPAGPPCRPHHEHNLLLVHKVVQELYNVLVLHRSGVLDLYTGTAHSA